MGLGNCMYWALIKPNLVTFENETKTFENETRYRGKAKKRNLAFETRSLDDSYKTKKN